MSFDIQRYKDRLKQGGTIPIDQLWGVSRGRDSYGYNICTWRIDDVIVARCNGGGYDMRGTCLGHFVAAFFRRELLRLPKRKFPQHEGDVFNHADHVRRGFYGLTFHDPTFDPGKVKVSAKHVDGTFIKDEDIGKTVEQLEKENKSLVLQRYQEFYRASSTVPTRKHRYPSINGACGWSSVKKILEALGYTIVETGSNGKYTGYEIRRMTRKERAYYASRQK